MIERNLPVPKLGADVELLLTKVMQVHLGSPNKFTYGQPLSHTSDNNFARRVAFYLLLGDDAWTVLEEHIKLARVMYEAWWAEVIADKVPVSKRADLAADLLKEISID